MAIDWKKEQCRNCDFCVATSCRIDPPGHFVEYIGHKDYHKTKYPYVLDIDACSKFKSKVGG